MVEEQLIVDSIKNIILDNKLLYDNDFYVVELTNQHVSSTMCGTYVPHRLGYNGKASAAQHGAKLWNQDRASHDSKKQTFECRECGFPQAKIFQCGSPQVYNISPLPHCLVNAPLMKKPTGSMLSYGYHLHCFNNFQDLHGLHYFGEKISLGNVSRKEQGSETICSHLKNTISTYLTPLRKQFLSNPYVPLPTP